MFDFTLPKRIAALAALGALVSSGAAEATSSARPTGVWLTEDGRARVLTETCGPARDALCGYVVWLKAPVSDDGKPRTDSKNPDAPKTARTLLGHQFILGLKLNDEGRYAGQIYNSEDGKKYDVSIWQDNPGQMKVKGCLVAFLCSTQTWTKTSDVLPGQLTGLVGAPGGPRADPEWAMPAAAAAGGAHPAGKREAKPAPALAAKPKS